MNQQTPTKNSVEAPQSPHSSTSNWVFFISEDTQGKIISKRQSTHARTHTHTHTHTLQASQITLPHKPWNVNFEMWQSLCYIHVKHRHISWLSVCLGNWILCGVALYLWVVCIELVSCHPSETYNFEVDPKTLWTPGLTACCRALLLIAIVTSQKCWNIGSLRTFPNVNVTSITSLGRLCMLHGRVLASQVAFCSTNST
jgi:hypothetical protein